MNCLQLNERMRIAEELVARRSARMNGGVDALLAVMADRTSLSPLPTGKGNLGGTEEQSVTPSTSLYPDLVHAANERRKIMKVNTYL